VLTRIAAASRAPVFGVFETYLGHGIAAGSIAGYEAQGRRAGDLVARVLNGEDPAAIGVRAPVESGCIADWRQLRHWGIDEGLLPAGCEIRFKGGTAWDRHKWQALAALGVILAQAALILALMLNHRRLRQAQATLADEYARRTQAEGLAARLRARLARFSRERSLGTMATSISHEINQPLIAIQNYAQAAKRRLQGNIDDKPKLIDLFAKIERQAERAGDITRRVRSLIGTSDLQLLPVSLCPLLEAVVRMMEPETEKKRCSIACRSVGDLPAVLADSLQVQLVLVNLLQNSMRSVCSSDRYDKRMFVEASPINDREVQVSVTDRGPGVPPDRVADIFEPLYSGTKGGMGMGLAISQAIVEAHGGRLWYDPNPAGGAIFRFTLRAVET
jgi:C4-dicarboxylate-specific signal transduction histidine kinase